MVRGPQALDLFNQIMGRTLSLLTVSIISGCIFTLSLYKIAFTEKFGVVCG